MFADGGQFANMTAAEKPSGHLAVPEVESVTGGVGDRQMSRHYHHQPASGGLAHASPAGTSPADGSSSSSGDRRMRGYLYKHR